MPKMKKDEVVRATLVRDGVVREVPTSSTLPRSENGNPAASQAAAIAARRAELNRGPNGGAK